jgi:hypothetical protein
MTSVNRNISLIKTCFTKIHTLKYTQKKHAEGLASMACVLDLDFTRELKEECLKLLDVNLEMNNLKLIDESISKKITNCIKLKVLLRDSLSDNTKVFVKSTIKGLCEDVSLLDKYNKDFNNNILKATKDTVHVIRKYTEEITDIAHLKGKLKSFIEINGSTIKSVSADFTNAIIVLHNIAAVHTTNTIVTELLQIRVDRLNELFSKYCLKSQYHEEILKEVNTVLSELSAFIQGYFLNLDGEFIVVADRSTYVLDVYDVIHMSIEHNAIERIVVCITTASDLLFDEGIFTRLALNTSFINNLEMKIGSGFQEPEVEESIYVKMDILDAIAKFKLRHND